MGQRITVTVRPGAAEHVRIFDTNRTLTGMEIERYPDLESAAGNEPPQVLARRLFELGAQHVGIYSNVVTVEAPADQWESIEADMVEAITHLFEYYGDEAGWSPAAREAMGVPVRPPKEAVAE